MDKLRVCTEYEKFNGLNRAKIKSGSNNISSWIGTQKLAVKGHYNYKMTETRLIHLLTC